jgi:hypothetical protein
MRSRSGLPESRSCDYWVDLGFTSVAEIHAPLEPGKPDSSGLRLWPAAAENVLVSTYSLGQRPPEDEIAARLVTSEEKAAANCSDDCGSPTTHRNAAGPTAFYAQH